MPVELEEDFRDRHGFALFLPRCLPSPGRGLASPASVRLVVQADAQPGPFSGLSLQDGPSCIPIPSMGSPCQVRAPPWSRVPHSRARSPPPPSLPIPILWCIIYRHRSLAGPAAPRGNRRAAGSGPFLEMLGCHCSTAAPPKWAGAGDSGLSGVLVPFSATGRGLGTSDVGLSRVQAALQAAALAARCTGGRRWSPGCWGPHGWAGLSDQQFICSSQFVSHRNNNFLPFPAGETPGPFQLRSYQQLISGKSFGQPGRGLLFQEGRDVLGDGKSLRRTAAVPAVCPARQRDINRKRP